MERAELWVLDRIEDGATGVLVSGTGEIRNVPASLLPEGVAEGAVLRAPSGSGEPRYVVDAEATARARREVENLRAALKRGPSGDLSL